MDRDSFWEVTRDIGLMVLKVTVVLFLLQVIFIAVKFDIHIPFVHDWVLKAFEWYAYYVN